MRLPKWLLLALLVPILWGVWGALMEIPEKLEGLFFYMAATGLALSPIALWMTDFSAPSNCSLSGPYLTATIQSLNSLGCLLFVYAVRYGKASSSFPRSTDCFSL